MHGRSPRIGDTAVEYLRASANSEAPGLRQPCCRFEVVAALLPGVDSRQPTDSSFSATSQRATPAGLAPKSGSRLPQSKVAPRPSRAKIRSHAKLLSKAQSFANEITSFELRKAAQTSPKAAQRLHDRNTRRVHRLLNARGVSTERLAA